MKSRVRKAILTSLLACLFGVSIVVGVTDRAQAASEKELVVMTWGGASLEAIKRAFFEPFTEETGIKILMPIASGDMYGKVAAQLRAGNVEWDIVQPDTDLMEAAALKGLVEPVDYTVVTDTKDMLPEALNKWGVGFEFFCYLLTYNKNAFPGDDHPKSWADFFDAKKFPGPRGCHNWGAPIYAYVGALLADGVPPDQLFPIDYDRAFKKWDQIKPHVKLWYTSGDKCVQALMDEEVVMAQSTGPRARMAMDMGAPTDIEWTDGIIGMDFWSVIKNAPHKEAAMQFLNFTCRPEQQAIYTNYFGSALCNVKSLDYLHPKFLKRLPTYPENLAKLVKIFTDESMPWIMEHSDEMNEKWNEWVSR